MEIEKKFLIQSMPADLACYTKHIIEQAYLSTEPVLRIRKKNEDYILTYKGAGMMTREEHEFPLTEASYKHLLQKADGNIITKTRYLIPDESGLTIELDVFSGCFSGLVMAEVEFPDLDTANAYQMPDWFSKEVTTDPRFHNSAMSQMSKEERTAFLRSLTAQGV